MFIYRDVINKVEIGKYEECFANFIKSVVEILYEKEYRNLGLDIKIDIKSDKIDNEEDSYISYLSLEPLYKGKNIECGEDDGCYDIEEQIVSFRKSPKRKRKFGEYHIYFEDNMSEIFKTISMTLRDLKENGFVLVE